MRIKRLRAAVLLLVLIALPACGGTKRTVSDPAALLQRRAQADEQLTADAQLLAEKLLRRSEAEYEAHQAGQRPDAPTIDVLIVSGGGDWGAFGAGFLQGWKEMPATEPLAMPEFDVVTGVSTGALIAPFAFLATDSALDRIEQLYRNPQKDWVKNRWPLYFLPSNLSFAEVPGLERELRQTLTLDMVREIAASSGSGRALFVNTTNLDDAGARVFDLIDEAKRAAESGDLSRIHSVMLASAGIPGAFPYREIDGEMYVDGGVTGNIIYGGRLSEEDSLPAVWQRTHPDRPIPRLRYWVIFNNQLRTLPTTVRARWPDVVQRALELGTRSATVTAMRHLHATAEISRLRRNADVEVRIVAIPGDWAPPVKGTFVKETMNELADLGKRMGADPSVWQTKAP